MTVSGVALVQTMQRRLGLRYVLGAKGPNAYDCSGWTWQGCRDLGISLPHGTVNQFPATIPCSLELAYRTPGALLFTWKGSDGGGGNGNHVAISRGDGSTSEARSRTRGCGSWPARGRGFTHGRLIRGIDYGVPTAPAQTTPPSPSPPAPSVPSTIPLEDDEMTFLFTVHPDGRWCIYQLWRQPGSNFLVKTLTNDTEWAALKPHYEHKVAAVDWSILAPIADAPQYGS